MVAPTTEKYFSRTIGFTYYEDKRWFVQAKPFNLMLPFNRRQHWAETVSGVMFFRADTSDSMETAGGRGTFNVLTAARNRSYERLVGKLGDASQLGSTLTAEGRQTWGTLVTIVTGLVTAARAIRRMDLAEAARALGLPYRERTRVVRHRVVVRTRSDGKKVYRTVKVKQTYFDWSTGRYRLKTMANGWLMYSYGVKPFMEDAYNSIDVLQRPLPWTRISGANTQKSTRLETWEWPRYIPTQQSWSVVASVKQSVDIRVSNPNLWLANRLGLINPVQMINEAIPFSFVVDWFSNLSTVISSMTDFVGLEMSNACVNTHVFMAETWANQSPWEEWRESLRDNRYTQRTLGVIIKPQLSFAYERFQWQRGLNAISLLVGLLPRK